MLQSSLLLLGKVRADKLRKIKTSEKAHLVSGWFSSLWKPVSLAYMVSNYIMQSKFSLSHENGKSDWTGSNFETNIYHSYLLVIFSKVLLFPLFSLGAEVKSTLKNIMEGAVWKISVTWRIVHMLIQATLN